MPLVFAAALVLAAPATDAKATISRMHAEFRRHMEAKNYEGVDGVMQTYLSRDFTWKKIDGSVMRYADLWENNQQDKIAKRQGRADGPLKYAPTLSGWKIGPTTATVLMRADIIGEWLKGNRRIPVTLQQVIKESWRLENGAWRAVAFTDVSVRGTIDGKPLP